MAKIILDGLSNSDARNLVNGGFFDADEIQYFLEQSTGLSLKVEMEDSVKADEDGDDIHTLNYTIEEMDEDEDEDEGEGDEDKTGY